MKDINELAKELIEVLHKAGFYKIIVEDRIVNALATHVHKMIIDAEYKQCEKIRKDLVDILGSKFIRKCISKSIGDYGARCGKILAELKKEKDK